MPDRVGPDRVGPGSFVAVIGASGVGKDTLLDAARVICRDSATFPRRAITRPAGPGEDYLSLSPEEFAAAHRRGEFAVRWHAHGLDYAIPSAADETVRAGGIVVANVSRGMIGELRERYENVVTVRITVSDDVRAARLRARRRESADDIAGRLSRADPAAGIPVDHEIRNDGTVAQATAALVRIIESASHERMETS